jgi:fluoride exporter
VRRSVVLTAIPNALVAVAVGGALGALVRTALVELVPRDPGQWPWVTFLINLAGTALLAWSVNYLAHHPGPVLSFIGTGFCGALTSFSTFQIEAVELIDEGSAPLALLYLVASLGFGLVITLAIARASARRDIAE